MRKINLSREMPYKVVARGFPIMRYSSLEEATESFNRFKGPGGCMLIKTSGKNRTEYKLYKYK